MSFGTMLPELVQPVPGPRSRELGRRLARVESRNITRIGDDGPIFWAEARGSNVRDVDGNTYIDLTAGFGVAAAGHGAPAVVEAMRDQAGRLVHALGDVHPADVKVELLERLAELAPGDLGVSILSANGSDAVESALKTAMLASGRAGVIAFRGGYHGLGFGALATTSDARFRAPFEHALYPGVRFATFPAASADPTRTDTARPGGPAGGSARALDEVRALVAAAADGPDAVGAVVVEPIQGRGGIVVPPDDFLPGLRELCDALDLVLIVDEVYTGFGRTGRWFAVEHAGIVPDLLVVGKSLGGGLPISAVIGTQGLMEAWPRSEGEAIHTSTFLGNPVASAAALAQLDIIAREGLVERAAEVGAWLRKRLESIVADRVPAVEARGLGLMQALVLRSDGRATGEARALAVARAALGRGVILLTEGPALAFTPPLVITTEQLDYALEVVGDEIGRLG